MRRHRRRGSTLLAVGAAVLLSAAIAPNALASSARVQGHDLTYVASRGEVNALTITMMGKNLRLVDSGASITAAGGCTRSSATVVNCPRNGVQRIVVDVGDSNDTVTNTTSVQSRLTGGLGNDLLVGGGGADFITGKAGFDIMKGGAGNDRVVTAGKFADQVICGSGSDWVRADRFDNVATDCETVLRLG